MRLSRGSRNSTMGSVMIPQPAGIRPPSSGGRMEARWLANALRSVLVVLVQGDHAVPVQVQAVELLHGPAPLGRTDDAVVVHVQVTEALVVDPSQDRADGAEEAHVPVLVL